jgi:hypothetical protein
MIGIIIYQIFFIKKNLFVLFEIFIIYLLLHLIYQIGFYGFYGSDSYVDYNFLKTILDNNGFILGQSVDGWPMIHVFFASTSLISKIDPFILAKFLPSLISSFIVFPYYLLIKAICLNKKIALFSCLIFGTIPQFISFEATFVRETLAIFIMIFFIAIVYITKKKNDYRLTFLTLLLIPVIVFAHHFTSLILILVLGTYIIVSKIIPFLYRKDLYIKSKLSGRINIYLIFLITLIAIVSYWIYHAIFILTHSSLIFYEVVGLREITTTYAEKIDLGSTIVTVRGNILYYGFFFFHLFFSIVLLLKFLLIKNKQKIEDTSFTLIFYMCIFYAFIALFILDSLVFPERFLPFAWIFGIIPLISLLIILNKNILKITVVLLLIFFMIFNFYNLEPEFYTGNISSKGNLTTEKDYIIAEQFVFPDEYFSYSGVSGAIYDIHGIDPKIAGKELKEISASYSSYITAIIKEEIYLKDLHNLKAKSQKRYDSAIEILSYKNNKNANKICDLGDIYILFLH